MRTDQELMQQAVKMYALLGSGPKAPHTEEVLGRLRTRIVFLYHKLRVDGLLRMHPTLDLAGVPNNGTLRIDFTLKLTRHLALMGQQIPAPTTT